MTLSGRREGSRAPEGLAQGWGRGAQQCEENDFHCLV